MNSDATSSTTVPDPMVPPLRNARYLIDRIVDVTSQPVQEVCERLEKEHADFGRNVREALKQWEIQPGIWSDRLVEFYNGTDAFLYETIVWNRSGAKNQMRRWIAQFLKDRLSRPTRLLIYGDGLGFDSLYLAQAGHHVEYYDLSSDGSHFAERLFHDYDQQVRILAAGEDVQPEAYDVVVCLDVLEHVPAPSDTVAFLAAALRPGGIFIVHAPFWYVDSKVGTHLRSNRKFSGDWRRLYAPHELRLCDGQFFWNPLVLQKKEMNTNDRMIRRNRLSTWLGGWLLFWGRFWSWPHRLAWRMISSRQWSEWHDLKEICRELE